MFQSTPPRGGRRLTSPSAPSADVSIHAPAWGATIGHGRRSASHDPSFNPRPRVGGDTGARAELDASTSFNPRPRVGGRLDGASNRQSVTAVVSIHAPARGATTSASTTRGLMDGFNPRPRAGGDRRGRNRALESLPSFNPRPRVGGDASGRCQHARLGFNPRPRVGGDRRSPVAVGPDRVSIHASAWGATQRGRHLPTYVSVSIHAPAWGATHRAGD